MDFCVHRLTVLEAQLRVIGSAAARNLEVNPEELKTVLFELAEQSRVIRESVEKAQQKASVRASREVVWDRQRASCSAS